MEKSLSAIAAWHWIGTSSVPRHPYSIRYSTGGSGGRHPSAAILRVARYRALLCGCRAGLSCRFAWRIDETSVSLRSSAPVAQVLRPMRATLHTASVAFQPPCAAHRNVKLLRHVQLPLPANLCASEQAARSWVPAVVRLDRRAAAVAFTCASASHSCVSVDRLYILFGATLWRARKQLVVDTRQLLGWQ
jgi:hypothetical protein